MPWHNVYCLHSRAAHVQASTRRGARRQRHSTCRHVPSTFVISPGEDDKLSVDFATRPAPTVFHLSRGAHSIPPTANGFRARHH